MVHGHADLHLVQADTERPGDTDSIIGRQQQEGTLGNRVAWAGDDDREGVRQHAPRQRRALCDQLDRGLGAGGHDLEVVTARQNARLAGENNDGPVLFGLIQRRVERNDHVRGNGIDLAVVQGQRGDTVVQMVRDQITHDVIPLLK